MFGLELWILLPLQTNNSFVSSLMRLIKPHPIIYFINNLAIVEALRGWEEGQDIMNSLDNPLDVAYG
jgi:hypothetical protein